MNRKDAHASLTTHVYALLLRSHRNKSFPHFLCSNKFVRLVGNAMQKTNCPSGLKRVYLELPNELMQYSDNSPFSPGRPTYTIFIPPVSTPRGTGLRRICGLRYRTPLTSILMLVRIQHRRYCENKRRNYVHSGEIAFLEE